MTKERKQGTWAAMRASSCRAHASRECPRRCTMGVRVWICVCVWMCVTSVCVCSARVRGTDLFTSSYRRLTEIEERTDKV